MKDLIILSQAPLTPQIKRNNYVDEYIDIGYTIQFWDISQLIHPGMKYNDEQNEFYQKRIVSLLRLEEELRGINSLNTIFILDFDPYWGTRHIFRLLSKYNCYKVRIDMYANTSLALTFKQRMLKLFSSRFKGILINRLGICLYKIYASMYNVSSCQRYYSSSSIVNRTDKINHPDYEEFLITKPERVIEERYILFVDTYFGAHPDDVFIYKNRSPLTVNKYQSSLNSFFAYLEHKYMIPVVIAAHPKSNYVHGEFENRRIIKYHTKDLILYADKVIMQLCNTISWVTLADKPFAFVTTDDYEALSYRKRLFSTLATLFDRNIYNIQHCKFSEVKFEKTPIEIRLHYIYTYLTDKEIEQRRNVDILKESYESISLPFYK